MTRNAVEPQIIPGTGTAYLLWWDGGELFHTTHTIIGWRVASGSNPVPILMGVTPAIGDTVLIEDFKRVLQTSADESRWHLSLWDAKATLIAEAALGAQDAANPKYSS